MNRERLEKPEKLNLLKSQNSEWKKKCEAEGDLICFIRERKRVSEGKKECDESSSYDWFFFKFFFNNLNLGQRKFKKKTIFPMMIRSTTTTKKKKNRVYKKRRSEWNPSTRAGPETRQIKSTRSYVVREHNNQVIDIYINKGVWCVTLWPCDLH
jgi:hypothetical protein